MNQLLSIASLAVMLSLSSMHVQGASTGIVNHARPYEPAVKLSINQPFLTEFSFQLYYLSTTHVFVQGQLSWQQTF